MRLFELFDDTYDTEVIRDDKHFTRIEFETDDGDEITIDFDRYSNNIFEIDFEGENMHDLSGESENPFKVFATVINEIKLFMNRDYVSGIMFSIDKGGPSYKDEAYHSRSKLYGQLLKRFAKNYNVEVKRLKYGDQYIITK